MKEEGTKTNLEADVVFKGLLNFSDILEVKGKVEGMISGDKGTIIIEETGSLEGQITAKEIDNRGVLKGRAQILGNYNLYTDGLSDAEIHTKHIMIEKGATFNGTCKMEK